MREEYDFSNAVKNPYAKERKEQDTVEVCIKQGKEPELMLK